MKKILLGALLSVALAVSAFVAAPAQQATYNGPYITTISGNGDIGPFPTYGQSVCGFTLHSGSGTLTMTVSQSVDGQAFATLGSPLTGLTKETQYTWSVLPNPPAAQALTSGQAGVTADKLTVTSFTGTPMRVFFGCTSSPLAVTPSSIGAVASVASAGAPIFVGGTATNPTVGLTTPLTVPLGGTGVASPNPAITATPCGASPGVSGTWPNVTYTVPVCATPNATATTGASVSGSYPNFVIGATGYNVFATTGNQVVTQATPAADTYYQVGSTLTGTTGVSTGPLGEWKAHIEMPMSQAVSTASQFSYGCITFTGTSNVVQNSTVYATSGATCKTALTNRIAGDSGFGSTTASTGPGYMGIAKADVILPNSTAWTASFYVAANGTVAYTIYAYGTVEWHPI